MSLSLSPFPVGHRRRRRRKTFPAETKIVSHHPIYPIHYVTRRYAPPPPLPPLYRRTITTSHSSPPSSPSSWHHRHRDTTVAPPRPRVRLVIGLSATRAFGSGYMHQGVRLVLLMAARAAFGTDIAKILRKRSKLEKHGHGKGKENTRARRMLSKVNKSQPLVNIG
ncbi:hypothetical protein Tco_0546594 [Tanacetum coccineum]